MEMSAERTARIELFLASPARQRLVRERLAIVNAILYVAESGCKWAALPKRFGHWHTIYPRMAALFVMDVSHRSRISQIRLHQLLVVLSLTKLAYTPSNIS